MKTLCAWCGHQMKEGDNDDAHAPISHGICPTCTKLYFDEPGETLREYINQFDVPIVVVENEPRFMVVNEKTCKTLGKDPSHIEGYLGGEVFNCVNSHKKGGCGHQIECKSCVLRNTVEETIATGKSFEGVPACNDVHDKDGVREARFIISTEKIGNTVMVRIEDLKMLEKSNEPENAQAVAAE